MARFETKALREISISQSDFLIDFQPIIVIISI